MNTLKEVSENHPDKMNTSKFYRFQLFVEGAEKRNTVGMAYLKEGHNIYTLRLWTFLEDKFFMLENRHDPSQYLLMTREPNKARGSKNKYFWSIVGNAKANSSKSVIELNFDLFEKTIYMNLFPEESATPQGQSIPMEVMDAA